MSDKMALKVAIDLMHVPSQVRLLRSEPLPDGVLTLLRIAAGDAEAEGVAATATDRSREVVQRAATFFIEQVLFAPNTDSYRVLGANAQASTAELRRNVALLMRWLHPDLDNRGERSVFVSRVTDAWNNLKTPERRAAYDELLRHFDAKRKFRHKNGRSRSGGQRIGGQRINGGPHRRHFVGNMRLMGTRKSGFFRRILSVLFHRPLQ